MRRRGWTRASWPRYEMDTRPPVYALKDKNCVAAERHMREDSPECAYPLCVIFGRRVRAALRPEALNRTGSPDEEGSSRDTVPTCWSIAPSLT